MFVLCKVILKVNEDILLYKIENKRQKKKLNIDSIKIEFGN